MTNINSKIKGEVFRNASDFSITVNRIELLGGSHVDVARVSTDTCFERFQFEVNLGTVKEKDLSRNLVAKLASAFRRRADRNEIGAQIARQYAADEMLDSFAFFDIVQFGEEIEKRLLSAAAELDRLGEKMDAAKSAKSSKSAERIAA